MKIVVTGGAGFIGSHFIKYMFREYPDCEILNVDKLTYAGNLDNLKEVENSPGYKFVREDICNADVMGKLIPGYDAVVNFAAESHVDRSLTEPDIFLKTDVMGTFNLLEICRASRIKVYIQISTDEVYGSISEGSFSEKSSLNPSNPYSASKASADLLALSYWKSHKVPVRIVRSTNNYGPNQYPEKMIPLFATNAIEDRELPVYGDGLQVRDWLFVVDNCAGINTVLQKGENGQIYNISAGNEKQNLFVIEEILKFLDKPMTLIKHVKDRPGHDRRYSIVSGKIRELGWTPSCSFEEGLRITTGWYAQNVEWWKKIKNGSFRDYYSRQYKNR